MDSTAEQKLLDKRYTLLRDFQWEVETTRMKLDTVASGGIVGGN